MTPGTQKMTIKHAFVTVVIPQRCLDALGHPHDWLRKCEGNEKIGEQ